MPNNNTLVGSKIKGIRESKNLSIEEIAESSGLSVDQINSIENDQNLPSLGPLIKIARALGVRLGTFMDDNDALGPVVCRAEDRERDSSIMINSSILACTVTSSAVVGSSAMIMSGLQASAMAMTTRCFMPPENWWASEAFWSCIPLTG